MLPTPDLSLVYHDTSNEAKIKRRTFQLNVATLTVGDSAVQAQAPSSVALCAVEHPEARGCNFRLSGGLDSIAQSILRY